MNTSEKINTLKEISKRLDSEEWGIIDLTLKLFGIPTTDEFEGNKLAYILKQVQLAGEKQILELANHLNIEMSAHKSEVIPTFWKAGSVKLFISHLASDKKAAQELKEALERYSISGFVAHSDIEPTKEWQNEIELALRTADALVALMIPKFHESKWTDQEIGLALGRDLFIMPVRMGEDPYGFIGKFQAINFSNLNQLAADIFESLLKNKKTSKVMAEGILFKFENSDSYASAKTNMGLVEKITHWDKRLENRLDNARKNNSQIRGSFGVTERINAILDDF